MSVRSGLASDVNQTAAALPSAIARQNSSKQKGAGSGAAGEILELGANHLPSLPTATGLGR